METSAREILLQELAALRRENALLKAKAEELQDKLDHSEVVVDALKSVVRAVVELDCCRMDSMKEVVVGLADLGIVVLESKKPSGNGTMKRSLSASDLRLQVREKIDAFRASSEKGCSIPPSDKNGKG